MARTSKSYYVVDVGPNMSVTPEERATRKATRDALKARGLDRMRFRTKDAADAAHAALDDTLRATVRVFEQFDLDLGF